MAAPCRRDRAPLSDELFGAAHRFDFFQAVRVLETLAREGAADAIGEQGGAVGGDQSPSHEAVRFRALPSHRFPAAAIRDIRRADGPPQMVTAFFGLTGPNGALPQHYTSLVIERIRGKDFALRDFFDMFNHRALSLFYRAWEKYRVGIGYERSRRGDAAEEDLFTRCLVCLIGLGSDGLRRRMQFDDEALLFFAGHFAHAPRNASALEAILADYFRLPVAVRQFQGRWLYLGPDDCSALPTRERPLGQNCRLGLDLVVGERVWDVEGKFRIRLGPMGYADFRRLLPSGDALKPLAQMVRTYAGPQFDFDVQVVLHAHEAPWCRLGGDPSDPAYLGWNTWVRSNPFQRPVDDAVFTLEV